MRIKSFEAKNHFLGWEIELIDFDDKLSLLVGVSGVGKTQILNAIHNLKKIANGESINGFEWKVTFETEAEKEFIWQGKFSVIEQKRINYFFTRSNEEEPIIHNETLTHNEMKIFNRNKDGFYYNDEKLPRLSSSESMISILKEEEIIESVKTAFDKITKKDYSKTNIVNTSRMNGENETELKSKYDNIETIKKSDLYIKDKIFISSENQLEVFNIIKNRFISIFPNVENIEFKQIKDEDYGRNLITPFLFIKEKQVKQWIFEENISSGMLRTFFHIAELYLSNDNSVILIDEFENSLGVNCIDILTEDLIHESQDIQFIATSHHPYIINNIPYEYWKVVSREGGKITVSNAAKLNLGKSKHDAFLQLTKYIETQAV